MNWLGPTYGMWADTVDDINEAYASLDEMRKNRDAWKAYAKKLEGALKDVAEKYRDMQASYIDAAGSVSGQQELKEKALEELAKTDPTSKMLSPAHRKALYDKKKEMVIYAMKAQ